MHSSTPLPSLEELKRLAKRLRSGLEQDGDFISHSEALELIARQYGKRDWNTLHAAIGNQPPLTVYPGARISAAYLGHAVKGEVLGVQKLGNGHLRISLELDEPVDVVTFESFSALRRRINATIDAVGQTLEKTSDGTPHLVIEAVR